MMKNYKEDFPLLMHSDIAYLDSAATAQRPACVLEAEKHFYETANAIPSGAFTTWRWRPPSSTTRPERGSAGF